MTETNFIKIPLSLREMGDCFNCIARLKDDVARLKGVERVEGAADTTQLRIEFDPTITSLEVIESYVSRQGARLTSHYGHEHYAIEGLDCPDCALKLEQSLSKIPGVTWVSVNFAASKIWFEYEADAVSRELILSAVKKAGYSFHEPEVSSVGVATTRSSFTLEGLDCPDCASKLQKRISLLDGIREIKIDFNNSTMAVYHETGKAGRAAIIAAVEEAGFRAMLMAGEKTEKPVSFFSAKNRKVLSTMAAGCFMILAWASYVLKPYLPVPSLAIAGHQLTLTHLFYLFTIATGGYYVARSGYYSLMSKTFDMNFLMSVAVLGALGIGEFEEGAMVVFLFSLGNTLQSYTMDKARNALRSLMDLAPKEAHLKKGGRLINVPASELRVGDLIIVKPGEKVSIDGLVAQGASSVNESPITGESQPVDKTPGDRVFAGAINGAGSLEVRVEKLAADSTLSRIIHLVEEAQAQKAPSQTFVDAFSKLYTPLVIFAAAAMSIIPPLVFSLPFSDWFYRGLMLLIISCPCALVLSTPVSIVSAIACASRKGILIKGGAYLEEMGAIGAIAFDKTGTLTCSRFEVTDIISINGAPTRDILATAASLEMKSEHPLAKAIVRRAQQQGVALRETRDLITYPGMGAQATLDSSSASIGNRSLLCKQGIDVTPYEEEMKRLENDGKTVVLIHHHATRGIIALADTLREEAGTCIEQLRKQGIRHMVMLTGDNERVSSAIARQIRLDGFKAALLPEEKVDAIRELLFKYEKVAMVGDGVNDAPALAVSSVGIAMGAASTDTALESADIALMADDLLKLPLLVHLSRKTLTIIKTNIALALIVKAAFIMTVFLGWANLWMAVAADMGTSLLVILNGMRLMVTRPEASSTGYAPVEQRHHQSPCACNTDHQ